MVAAPGFVQGRQTGDVTHNRTRVGSVLLKAQRVTSEFLLEEINQSRHTEVALAISQHGTCTALEAIKCSRR